MKQKKTKKVKRRNEPNYWKQAGGIKLSHLAKLAFKSKEIIGIRQKEAKFH